MKRYNFICYMSVEVQDDRKIVFKKGDTTVITLNGITRRGAFLLRDSEKYEADYHNRRLTRMVLTEKFNNLFRDDKWYEIINGELILCQSS